MRLFRIALAAVTMAAAGATVLPAPVALANHSTLVFPVTGRVISDYGDARGPRDCNGDGIRDEQHCGYDLAADPTSATGDPVYASYSGNLTGRMSGTNCNPSTGTTGTSYGLTVYIDHGAGYQTRYAHLQQIVRGNGWVNRGDLIGYEGVSGNASTLRTDPTTGRRYCASTTPHVHYEILRHGAALDLSGNGTSQQCTPSSAICVNQRITAGNPIPYHFEGLAPIGPTSPAYREITRSGTGDGYWVVGSDGGVFSYGDARFHGSLPGLGIATNRIMGIQSTPSGGGYWLVQNDGGVFAFGNAPFRGSLPGLGIATDRIRAIAGTPTGNGYWLVQTDGGVFAFGDAGFHGALPGSVTVSNIVDIAATPTGRGYYLVGSDGGVFAFGDATYLGSLPGIGVARNNVAGIAADPDGNGYWLVTGNGEIYGFGAAYLGGVNHLALAAPIEGIDARDSAGYWLLGGDGGVFAFGTARYYGRPG